MQPAVIDLTPLTGYLFEAIGLVLLALTSLAVAYLSAWIKRKSGIELDNNARNTIERAIHGGISFAMEKLRDQDLGRVEVRNQAIADAANYVIERVPDSLKRFGLAPQDVATIVTSRVGSYLDAPRTTNAAIPG